MRRVLSGLPPSHEHHQNGVDRKIIRRLSHFLLRRLRTVCSQPHSLHISSTCHHHSMTMRRCMMRIKAQTASRGGPVRNCLTGAWLFVALLCVDVLISATTYNGAPGIGLFVSSARADDDDDRGVRRGGFSGGGFGLPGLPSFGIPLPRFGAPSRPRSRRPAAPEAIRREWIASGLSDSDVATVRAAGFAVVAERRLTLLPAVTVRLRAPRNLSDRAAQDRLRALIPAATLDRNHLYRAS